MQRILPEAVAMALTNNEPKAHPARKLLNALAEAVEGNQGDGAQERDLLNRVEGTVDHLVAGFNDSFSLIKLACISPISSRLMFVNRRGTRVLVVSVQELAQMKKQGKLIIHAEENLFEQTLDGVLHRLKADFS